MTYELGEFLIYKPSAVSRGGGDFVAGEFEVEAAAGDGEFACGAGDVAAVAAEGFGDHASFEVFERVGE